MAFKYKKTRFKQKARTSRKVGGSRYATRRAGAFGLYRGTKFQALRAVANRYGKAPIPRFLNPFPNSKLVRHKYVGLCTLPAGSQAAVPTVYQFRANSVYDPDFSTTGHKPMFTDQMEAQYMYYTVLRSKIRISLSGTNAQELNYALWLDDDTAIPTNVEHCLEQHASNVDRLDRRSNTKVMTCFYDAARYNKTTRMGIMGDDDQKILKGNNPPAKVAKWYQFYVAPLAGTTQVAAIPFRAELYFLVLWRDAVDHIGS